MQTKVPFLCRSKSCLSLDMIRNKVVRIELNTNINPEEVEPINMMVTDLS